MYAGLIPRCAASSVRNRAEFEDRAGPDHSLRRNPVSGGEDGHNLRHDVDRIRRHQKDGVRRRGQHCRHDRGKDFGVARQQVQPALPGLLLGPGRKHDNARAVEIGRLPGADPDGIRPRRRVQNVVRLGHRQIRLAIDEQNLRTDATHRHGIGGGGPNLPGSDDSDLHNVPPILRTGYSAVNARTYCARSSALGWANRSARRRPRISSTELASCASIQSAKPCTKRSR